MTKTMAEVLAGHQPTSKLLSPSDVRVACLCGRFAQDDELPTYHNSWIIAHQAAALSAAGFGLVADAWDEGCEEATDHYAEHAYDPNANGPADPPRNPYRNKVAE